MPNKKVHKIQRLKVEIETDDKMLALKLQDQFSELCHGRLKDLLDQEFDRLSDDDAVMRIDRLEVDLGNFGHYLDQEQLLRELPQKLTSAVNEAGKNGLIQVFKRPKPKPEQNNGGIFSEPDEIMDPDLEFIEPDELADDDAFAAMAEKMGQTPEQLWQSISQGQSDGPSQAEQAQPDRSDSQGFLYYLLTGQLAWWSEAFDAAEVDRLFALIEEGDAPYLMQLMHNHPEAAIRIASQATIERQRRLLGILAADNANVEVLRFVNVCQLALSRHRVEADKVSGREGDALTSATPFVAMAWQGFAELAKYRPPADVSFAALLERWRTMRQFKGWRARILAMFEQLGQTLIDARYYPFIHQLRQTESHDTLDKPVESSNVELFAEMPQLPECLDACGEPLMVGNAGLALLVTQIPALFERLGLVVEDKFIDAIAQQKALHLLQYLVTGSSEDEEDCCEAELALNKLLCGLHPVDFAWRDCRLSENEKAAADAMLEQVVSGYERLEGMAIDEFRDVFMQRHGLIGIRDHLWLLRIESEGRDIFIRENLSPCYSVCYPWMPVTLSIEWCDHDIENPQI